MPSRDGALPVESFCNLANRNNQPVTQREQPFPKGSVIISHADQKGRITHANDAFVDISGFTREELYGQSRNIVRHPDMPLEAFRDLWQTATRGRPWMGIVKNRCKNGDHYWVRAYVTPLPDESGYVSVHTQASGDEINAAEALYARMRGNEKIRLQDGQVVQPGLRGLVHRFGQHLRISHRLWAAFLVSMALAMLGITLSSQTAVSERFSDYLKRVALFDPRSIVGDNGVLLPLDQMPSDTAAAIASIEVEEQYDGEGKDRKWIGRTTRVRFWNKVDALDKTMKHLGLYGQDNRQKVGLLDKLPRATLREIERRLTWSRGKMTNPCLPCRIEHSGARTHCAH